MYTPKQAHDADFIDIAATGHMVTCAAAAKGALAPLLIQQKLQTLTTRLSCDVAVLIEDFCQDVDLLLADNTAPY